MNFIKRWIWGDVSNLSHIIFAFDNFTNHHFVSSMISQDSEQPEAPAETKSSPHSSSLVPVQPVLREVPLGAAAAPVQGLDWYRRSLLEDADGDCANDFLEEPQKHHSDETSPAAKKLHMASLQSNAGNAVPAHVATLTVERGHVTHSREIP